MEKVATPVSKSALQHILTSTGLSEEGYRSIKSRTALLLNDAFKRVYGAWTGYEISVIGVLDNRGLLNFLVTADRSRMERDDKEAVPYLYEMLHGKDSIMMDVVRIQHQRQYDLRYSGDMGFMDARTGLNFKLATHVKIGIRT